MATEILISCVTFVFPVKAQSRANLVNTADTIIIKAGPSFHDGLHSVEITNLMPEGKDISNMLTAPSFLHSSIQTHTLFVVDSVEKMAWSITLHSYMGHSANSK